MEEFKKKSAVEMGDKEIIFSKSIKAGKRIYYLDVKRNRKDEMFLAITESKKIVSSENDDPQISFEKHKIFLYKEDFEKFLNGLHQAIEFINNNQASPLTTVVNTNIVADKDISLEKETVPEKLTNEIKIDIDF